MKPECSEVAIQIFYHSLGAISSSVSALNPYDFAMMSKSCPIDSLAPVSISLSCSKKSSCNSFILSSQNVLIYRVHPDFLEMFFRYQNIGL